MARQRSRLTLFFGRRPRRGVRVTDDRSSEGAHWSGAPQRLRRLLNTPRSFDPRTARIAVGILGTIATTDAWVRYDPTHRDFFWLRCGIPAPSRLVGHSVGMGRWSFRGSAAIRSRSRPGSRPRSGTSRGRWDGTDRSSRSLEPASSSASVFLQTGTDLLVGIALMAAGQATLVALLPPRGIPSRLGRDQPGDRSLRGDRDGRSS